MQVSLLFEHHGGMVLRRCRQLLGSEDAARDAVQEVFLRVVQKHHGFRGRSSPVTWLYSIATLYCLQQLRNEKRRKMASLPQGDPVLIPLLDEKMSLDALLALEDDMVRTIVVLRHVDQLEVEAIAQALGCSRKTVTRKLQRFVETARQHLTEGASP